MTLTLTQLGTLAACCAALAVLCVLVGYWLGHRPPQMPRKELAERLKKVLPKKKTAEQYEDAWHKAQTEPLPNRIPTMEVE